MFCAGAGRGSRIGSPARCSRLGMFTDGFMSMRRNDWLWFLGGLFWTGVIVSFAWYEQTFNYENVLRYASIEARADFNRDVLYRRWAAGHGGVYAQVSPDNPPNPYLKGVAERDIVTPSGRQLTLINPAYMTRQIYELAARQTEVRGHLTSLDPLRPENAPDAWERSSLQAFEDGQQGVEERTAVEGKPYLRAMYPLHVEPQCLSCHVAQGYRVGAVRGGISVTIPLAPYLEIYRQGHPGQALYHGAIWLLGLGCLLFLRNRVNRQFRFVDEALDVALVAEQTLLEQKLVYDKVQAMGSIGGWEYDLVSNALTWSREIYAIFQVPEGTAMSYQRFLASIHPDDVARVDAAWRGALAGEGTYDIEHRLLLGGNVVWVREKADIEFDLEGRPRMAHGLTQDITLRKHEELVMAAQLRLSDYATGHSVNELLRGFLDEAEGLTGSTIGFYHFVREDQKTVELQTWSSHTLATMCSATVGSGHYPLDDAGVWVDCVHEKRPVIHNDYAALPHRKGLPEGHAPVVRELVVPVFRNNRIVAILGVGNKPADYSDEDVRTVQKLADLAWETVSRRQAEEALRENEERFHTMFRDHDAIMLLVDPEQGYVVDANASASRFYGYPPDRLRGMGIEQINADTPEKVALARLSAARGEKNYFEFRHRLSSGEVRDVEVHSSPVALRGRILLFSIIHDISQRKRLMDEYRRSAQLAALGTVAAGVAHEINNPMQGVLNYATLILHAPENPERVADLSARIVREGERVARLTRTLLHYSKDTRGEFVVTDIRQPIGEAIELVKMNTAKRGVAIGVLLPDEAVKMAIHSQGIQQMVINLLDNACDALAESGGDGEKRVVVSGDVTTLEGRRCFELWVEDNGIGIPEEHLERVRDAFFSTKPSARGTGLGLAIVGDIVAQHQGDFDIRSVAGEGTCVSVRLPLRG